MMNFLYSLFVQERVVGGRGCYRYPITILKTTISMFCAILYSFTDSLVIYNRYNFKTVHVYHPPPPFSTTLDRVHL